MESRSTEERGIEKLVGRLFTLHEAFGIHENSMRPVFVSQSVVKNNPLIHECIGHLRPLVTVRYELQDLRFVKPYLFDIISSNCWISENISLVSLPVMFEVLKASRNRGRYFWSCRNPRVKTLDRIRTNEGSFQQRLGM